MDFPGGSEGKESTCKAGDLSWIAGLVRSLEEDMAAHSSILCLENPHGQRGLVGYSPWGRKESDTTGQLHTAHLEIL